MAKTDTILGYKRWKNVLLPPIQSSTTVVPSERQVIWIIGSTDIPSGKKNGVSSLIANQRIALPNASSVKTLGGCCDHNPELSW